MKCHFYNIELLLKRKINKPNVCQKYTICQNKLNSMSAVKYCKFC
jgi:hypothetical protein